MSDAARTRRDARYEPQLAGSGRDASGHGAAESDPLAELARLVGQEDPFRSMFRQPRARAEPEAWPDQAPPPAHAPGPHPAQGYGAPADDGYAEHEHGHHGHAEHDHDAHGQRSGDAHEHDDLDVAQARYYAAEQEAYPDEAGLADAHLAPDYPVGAALADDWAREGAGGAPVDAGPAPAPAAPTSARRPLAVLAAVLVLTGGGLAASFLAKGRSAPSAVAAANGAAPTIMAASGPTKIKVDAPAATAPEDQDAALLNKNGAPSSGPVKIVSSQEQPADLGQLPKADLADGARPLPPAPPNTTSEPKRVKTQTFLVHPDGRLLSADGSAPAADAPTGTPRAAAANGGATPKAAAAPSAAPTIASLAADPAVAAPDPAAPAAKPGRQPSSPGPRTASAKPNDAATAPAAAGNYGVQLASSPVEADANAAFARLKKQYPTLLGGYTATVHRAETGDKPVYRVRVGGMSQDEAKALCSQLMNAGGTCVVMRR